MDRVDFQASERHFVDHLAPVWHALPAELRGDFLAPTVCHPQAARHGILATTAATSPGRRMVVASYGELKRARQRGRRRFAYLEHGIGQSYAGRPGKGARHPSYAGGDDRADVQLFLMPNQTAAARWAAAYPHADIRVVGSPKVDRQPARDPGSSPAPTVALSWHWNCGVVPETRSTFGYFRSAIPQLMAAGVRLIGHGHPRIVDQLGPWYRRWGVPLVRDFDDVLAAADLYVCDNSSTIYEFAAAGRPVVVLNGPGYRRDVQHGLRFWEAADVGFQVDDPSQLLQTVQQALADPDDQRERRQAALQLVYGELDGHAADRAAAAIAAWIGDGD